MILVRVHQPKDFVFSSVPCAKLNLEGPMVSMPPRTDSSGTDILFSSNPLSMKMTTTVISSWKKRRTPFWNVLRSSYFICLFLAASSKAALRSLLAIPYHWIRYKSTTTEMKQYNCNIHGMRKQNLLLWDYCVRSQLLLDLLCAPKVHQMRR